MDSKEVIYFHEDQMITEDGTGFIKIIIISIDHNIIHKYIYITIYIFTTFIKLQIC